MSFHPSPFIYIKRVRDELGSPLLVIDKQQDFT